MVACCEQTVASSVAGVLLLALLVSPVFWRCWLTAFSATSELFGVDGELLLALIANCLGVVGRVLWMSELLLASR